MILLGCLPGRAMADTPGSPGGNSGGGNDAAPADGPAPGGGDEAARARAQTALPSSAAKPPVRARPVGFLASRPKAKSLGGQHSAGDGAVGDGGPVVLRQSGSESAGSGGGGSSNAGSEMKRSLRAFGDKLMYDIEAGSKRLAAKMKEDRERARVRGLWEQRKERIRALRWKEDRKGERVDKAKCVLLDGSRALSSPSSSSSSS